MMNKTFARVRDLFSPRTRSAVSGSIISKPLLVHSTLGFEIRMGIVHATDLHPHTASLLYAQPLLGHPHSPHFSRDGVPPSESLEIPPPGTCLLNVALFRPATPENVPLEFQPEPESTLPPWPDVDTAVIALATRMLAGFEDTPTAFRSRPDVNTRKIRPSISSTSSPTLRSRSSESTLVEHPTLYPDQEKSIKSRTFAVVSRPTINDGSRSNTAIKRANHAMKAKVGLGLDGWAPDFERVKPEDPKSQIRKPRRFLRNLQHYDRRGSGPEFIPSSWPEVDAAVTAVATPTLSYIEGIYLFASSCFRHQTCENNPPRLRHQP